MDVALDEAISVGHIEPVSDDGHNLICFVWREKQGILADSELIGKCQHTLDVLCVSDQDEREIVLGKQGPVEELLHTFLRRVEQLVELVDDDHVVLESLRK